MAEAATISPARRHLEFGAASVRRILSQLAHDHRSVAMIVVVPVALLTIIYYMLADVPHAPDQLRVFDRIGAVMLGFFPFFIMFIVTSITMLRERTSGTLERLMSTPIGKIDLLFGYAAAFALVALVQVTIMVIVTVWVFDLAVAGSLWWIYLIALADALLGVGLGLLVSAFARTEFQVVQFVPALIVPQLLLCGLFVPREQMADWLEALSRVMPLTYAVQAITEIAEHAEPTSTMLWSLLIVVVVAIGSLIAAAATLRRTT